MDRAPLPPFTPGIDYTMPPAIYHAIDATGSSDVKRLLRSPAHYRAGLDADDEPSDAQQLGTAIHLAVLEPARFDREVVTAPKFDRRTKDGKAAAEAFEAEHSAKLILPGDAFDTVRRVADAVRAHPAAAYLLAEGAPEVSLQWQHEATGTRCKARVDWLRPDHTLVDLKSARDASPAGFARAVGQYGYALQAAHYLAGARAVLQAEPPAFVFIAIEKEPPYAVGVYVLDDEALIAASGRVEEAMQRHADCRASNVWPAYADLIQTITLPKWAL